MPSNLTVSPLTPEEAHLYVSVRHETFRPTINKILYSREPSQATLDGVTQGICTDIAKGTALYMKVTDDETGEMIAGSKWGFVPPNLVCEDGQGVGEGGNEIFKRRERTWEEVEAGLTIPTPYDESNVGVWNKLFTLLNSNKREIMQTRPYLILETLVTHPSHHRRGAGGMLVQWGCDQADTNDLEAYLEASPMGAPLYERFGFQRVKDIQLDLREFGGEVFTFIIMVRPTRAVL
ncbi:uncharacterized protein BDR25DRAFT_276014 [Lindgomyces ingoldianus]|uniref:Uncharacterized protein n=1 Tax=Lindgomyces ingoldianus TaxID=673940 RepID=A0ACB6RI50_9PLEO|nr:uncharacterized protein BDR25DRAFT_276014 [Lindgomyces ingoldianus]KAF2478197.1 hypothetical protein BDR25DRAFT_276014 [Lindgomyces ingoldianus]